MSGPSKPYRMRRKYRLTISFGRPRPGVIWWSRALGEIVIGHDAFSPTRSGQPSAPREVGGSVAVTIRSEDGQPVRAQLHDLSATGGLLILSQAFEQGDFVELAFQTSQGKIHGLAEVLAARRELTSGCLQPFRFVALEDEDRNRLSMALDSLLDQTMVGVPSSKPPSP